MNIGPHVLDPPLILAPMAGITDLPFRTLCRRLGASMAVSEMVHADMDLWSRTKSRLRLADGGEQGPRSVQIVGYDAQMMARAACAAVERGAQIIDINMGCPARKVTCRSAGSALLGDEARVESILRAIVGAVDVPVTLKIRLGLDRQKINAPRIASIAQDCGISALAVHGRTRACRFKGTVDLEAIARVKQSVQIPVIANGDIRSPEDALRSWRETGADALMIGRGACGRPWLFGQIAHYLRTGQTLPEPPARQIRGWMLEHLQAMHDFYGPSSGVRIARKHLGWYLEHLQQPRALRDRLMQTEQAEEQMSIVQDLFDEACTEAEGTRQVPAVPMPCSARAHRSAREQVA